MRYLQYASSSSAGDSLVTAMFHTLTRFPAAFLSVLLTMLPRSELDGPGVADSLRSFLTLSADIPELTGDVMSMMVCLCDAAAAFSSTRAGVWRGLKPPAVIFAIAACWTCGLGVAYVDGAELARREGRGVSRPRIGIVAERSPLIPADARLGLTLRCDDLCFAEYR